MKFLLRERDTTLYKRLFLITTTLFLFACSNDNTVGSDSNSEPATTAEEALSKNQIKELKQNAPTLDSAIALFKSDDSIAVDLDKDKNPQLLVDLLFWNGIIGITWQGLNNIPETNYPLIKKDVVGESGKRFCFLGYVRKIQVDRSMKPAITNAIMYAKSRGYVYLLAVGSSGNILPESEVKFCGIVTGNKNYQTFAGMDSAPYLIGMFDLPENKE